MLVEFGWLLGNPIDKLTYVLVLKQQINRVIFVLQLFVGERCMDLLVTHSMQANSVSIFPTRRLWNQVMFVNVDITQWSLTQWA